MTHHPAWSYDARWALVTGASAGLGRAYATALAARGMNLVLTARRRERLELLAAELGRRHGVEAQVVAADLAEPGAPATVWRSAVGHGRIHLLVNNAGFGSRGAFHAQSREDQLRMVRLNALAVVELSHLALAHMRDAGEGAILNVASTAAFQPVPRMAVYGATKAFVLSFTEALWAEVRDSPVRVVGVCPGRTPTEFQAVAGTSRVRSSRLGVLEAEEVVERSLRALERGKHMVVPGLANRVGAFAHRLLPRGWIARCLDWGVRRFG